MNYLCRIGVCLRSFFLKKTNKLVNGIILQHSNLVAARGRARKSVVRLVLKLQFGNVLVRETPVSRSAILQGCF